MKNNFLAVDTSSKVLTVAVSSGKEGVFEAQLDGTPRHSELLIDLVQQGLQVLSLKKSDLTGFLWGMGPGSFTGLRIGAAALKGFLLGLGKRALGASSLDLIALGTGLPTGELAVCVDARRQHIYTAIYRFKKNQVQRTLQDSLFSFDQLMRHIGPETVIVGDALQVYGERIQDRFDGKAVFLNPFFWYPRAGSLIRMHEEYRDWLKPLSLRSMAPSYLRSSEAEEKLNHKSKAK